MQNTVQNPYEYSYGNIESCHHHNYLLQPLLKLISQQAVHSSEKLRVLDLGCGNGSLTKTIAENGYEVVGVEDSISGFMFASQNIPECKFIQANIYDLPYAELEGTFDVVISAEVIEHLLYPRELLKASKKCLKPKGRLILTTPYHGYWKSLAIALIGKMDSHFNPLWDGGHVKFFSVPTLTNLLEQEGFSHIQFEFAGRIPYLWKSMLCSSTIF